MEAGGGRGRTRGMSNAITFYDPDGDPLTHPATEVLHVIERLVCALWVTTAAILFGSLCCVGGR